MNGTLIRYFVFILVATCVASALGGVTAGWVAAGGACIFALFTHVSRNLALSPRLKDILWVLEAVGIAGALGGDQSAYYAGLGAFVVAALNRCLRDTPALAGVRAEK